MSFQDLQLTKILAPRCLQLLAHLLFMNEHIQKVKVGPQMIIGFLRSFSRISLTQNNISNDYEIKVYLIAQTLLNQEDFKKALSSSNVEQDVQQAKKSQNISVFVRPVSLKEITQISSSNNSLKNLQNSQRILDKVYNNSMNAEVRKSQINQGINNSQVLPHTTQALDQKNTKIFNSKQNFGHHRSILLGGFDKQGRNDAVFAQSEEIEFIYNMTQGEMSVKNMVDKNYIRNDDDMTSNGIILQTEHLSYRQLSSVNLHQHQYGSPKSQKMKLDSQSYFSALSPRNMKNEFQKEEITKSKRLKYLYSKDTNGVCCSNGKNKCLIF